MLKIAGGMILGFFGIITLCAFLHDCSGSFKNNEKEKYKEADNKELAYECRNAFLEKLKEPSKLNYSVGAISRLGFNDTSIIVFTITNPNNTGQMASIGCTIKQIGNNEFETHVSSESYIGGIEK